MISWWRMYSFMYTWQDKSYRAFVVPCLSIMQGTRKFSFPTLPSGNLWPGYASPKVIFTSPKKFLQVWWIKLISSKTIHPKLSLACQASEGCIPLACQQNLLSRGYQRSTLYADYDFYNIIIIINILYFFFFRHVVPLQGKGKSISPLFGLESYSRFKIVYRFWTTFLLLITSLVGSSGLFTFKISADWNKPMNLISTWVIAHNIILRFYPLSLHSTPLTADSGKWRCWIQWYWQGGDLKPRPCDYNNTAS